MDNRRVIDVAVQRGYYFYIIISLYLEYHYIMSVSYEESPVNLSPPGVCFRSAIRRKPSWRMANPFSCY